MSKRKPIDTRWIKQCYFYIGPDNPKLNDAITDNPDITDYWSEFDEEEMEQFKEVYRTMINYHRDCIIRILYRTNLMQFFITKQYTQRMTRVLKDHLRHKGLPKDWYTTFHDTKDGTMYIQIQYRHNSKLNQNK